MDSRAGPCDQPVLKGIQTNRTAIIAKQETRFGANRVGNSILAVTARGVYKYLLLSRRVAQILQGPCYDRDVGGLVWRTGFKWLRSFTPFVSPGNFEVGEMDGVAEGSTVVEYFSWCAPIGKFSRVVTGPGVHDDL